MPHSETEQEFVDKVRQTLNDQPLDAETRQRLNRMRMDVLSRATTRRWMHFVKPLLAIASVAIIAVFVSLQLQQSESIATVDKIDAFEIISSNDDLEMYQNLEFYLWLDEQKSG